MKTVLLILALACLSVTPVLGEESGRKAKVHLRDGAILDGIVLDCANGVLDLATTGQKRSIDLDSISRIVFGEPVGPHVRVEPKPLDIDDRRDSGGVAEEGTPPRERTEEHAALNETEAEDKPPLVGGPRTKPPGRDEEHQRRLNEFVRWVWRLNMFQQLDLSTDRFRDAALIKKTTANWEAKLRETPEKGEANKDIRLALVTLAVADQQRLRAHALLASLKKDYPDDEALQKLTIGAIEFAVLRARLAPPRPRGPEVRPDLRPKGRSGRPD